VWEDRLWKYLLTGCGLGACLDVAGPAGDWALGIETCDTQRRRILA
jgi:hypothetical protein